MLSVSKVMQILSDWVLFRSKHAFINIAVLIVIALERMTPFIDNCSAWIGHEFSELDIRVLMRPNGEISRMFWYHSLFPYFHVFRTLLYYIIFPTLTGVRPDLSPCLRDFTGLKYVKKRTLPVLREGSFVFSWYSRAYITQECRIVFVLS